MSNFTIKQKTGAVLIMLSAGYLLAQALVFFIDNSTYL